MPSTGPPSGSYTVPVRVARDCRACVCATAGEAIDRNIATAAATSARIPKTTLGERCPQHGGIHAARMKRTAAGGTGQPHFSRAEEQRIDFVEVVVVAFEDVIERRTVVRR